MKKSPDHGSSPTPDTRDPRFEFDERDKLILPLLSPEGVAKLREAQQAIVNKEQAGIDPLKTHEMAMAETRADAQFPGVIEDYLKDMGIRDDDPERGHYLALLSDYSLNNMDQAEWNTGGKETEEVTLPDGTKTTRAVSGRERLTRDYNDFVNQIYDYNDTIPAPVVARDPADILKDVDNDKDIIEQRTRVEELRSDLAKLSAKRQGRLRDSSKLVEQYRELEARYNREMTKLVEMEIDAENKYGMERTEDEEKMAVALKLIEGMKDLEGAAAMELASTKTSKVVAWLTSGNVAVRILKGAGVGVA